MRILFIVGSTFLIFSRSISIIHGGVFHRRSQHLKTKEDFPPNLRRSEMRSASLMPSSHNCFDWENSFHLSGAIQDSFQFVSLEPIISEFIHSQLSVVILQSYRCFFIFLLRSFSILTVVRSRFFLPCDHINSFVVFNPTSGFVEDHPKFALYLA